MPPLAVRGHVLPDGDVRTIYFDGDRITFEPVANADVVHNGGWIVPGLVDVHTHPGVAQPGDTLDEDLLRTHLLAHAENGVSLLRFPGIAGGWVPEWVHDDPALPRVISAGHWLAAENGFFPGWGRQLAADELADAAVGEVARTGEWCKVVVDWASGEGTDRRYGPTIPPEVVAAIVERVHAVGGRVAVHTQHPDGAEAAVLAGADSIEHGMLLPERLFDRMAAQGTALVPTMTVIELGKAARAVDPPTRFSRFIAEGSERHATIVRAAAEAGVLILAGTDSAAHHGDVAREASLLASAGVAGEVAAGAASWTSRRFLGLPGLEEGAPADLVVYDADPRVDVAGLGHPAGIALKGNVVL